MACIDFYFARCMNIFNSLLAQLVKYDVHTTRKIKIYTRHFLSHIIIILWPKLPHPATRFMCDSSHICTYLLSY